MPGVGKDFKPVKPGQKQLKAGQVNQFIGPVEASTRDEAAGGLAVRELPGGAKSVGLAVGFFAHAISDEDGIPGCDDSDPDVLVPGEGWIYVRVETVDGLVKKAMKEKCYNRWKGAVPPETELDVINYNGYWRVFALECPTS